MPIRRALKPGESGYVDGHTTTQSWGQWAGQKFRRSGSDTTTMDEVTLFPGWASRCYVKELEHESKLVSCCTSVFQLKCLLFLGTFDLDVYVSGYATTRRSPEFLTRSQRGFLRLAKGALICN